MQQKSFLPCADVNTNLLDVDLNQKTKSFAVHLASSDTKENLLPSMKREVLASNVTYDTAPEIKIRNSKHNTKIDRIPS